MTKNTNSLNVNIVTVRDGKETIVAYTYNKREEKEKPMALDVLMQAQSEVIPDLAFRYGCRARNCGVCTIDINDRPRVACRARVKDGDKLSAIATLPVLSDLVVRRDGIARQMRGLKTSAQGNDLNVDAPEVYHDLTSCIECYACLDKCPMHMRNFEDILDLFISEDACIKLNHPDELFLAFKKLLDNDSLRKDMVDKALKVINENKGSTAKHYKYIQNILK